ncbi:MAG: hypothetical protein K2X77_06870, partial [Candidatus Obscuribacterales bacterium]|nr:hypothetical protein [Candidatus Obscuribacterales bacterium]
FRDLPPSASGRFKLSSAAKRLDARQPTVKQIIACIKPLAFRIKHVAVKAWALAVHVYNAHAGDQKEAKE